MKALISDIKRFAVHDGDGIRTTVFFKGCPLKCVWCHNPESQSAQKQMMVYSSKCIGCGKCSQVCPAGAITMTDGLPRIDRDRCIRCFCCQEFCPKGAMKVHRPKERRNSSNRLARCEMKHRPDERPAPCGG